MDISRLHAHWRPLYLGSVGMAAAASYVAWPGLPRAEVERMAFAVGWAAFSVGYALLGWKTREAESPWNSFDLLTAIALGVVGGYEAIWPGTGQAVTPAVLGMIVAGVAFRASLRPARRIPQPTVPTLPEH